MIRWLRSKGIPGCATLVIMLVIVIAVGLLFISVLAISLRQFQDKIRVFTAVAPVHEVCVRAGGRLGLGALTTMIKRLFFESFGSTQFLSETLSTGHLQETRRRSHCGLVLPVVTEGSPLPYPQPGSCPRSKTHRTALARPSGVNGFSMKHTPLSSRPAWTTEFRV